MPFVTFINVEGLSTTVETPIGASIMAVAVANGVDGITGECGGSAMCATCHVYVESDFGNLLPPMTESEEAMLESTAAERKANSRLSCQITMNGALDGLVVHLPPTQI
jgi:ferredoxin, 2Fe-2S